MNNVVYRKVLLKQMKFYSRYIEETTILIKQLSVTIEEAEKNLREISEKMKELEKEKTQ